MIFLASSMSKTVSFTSSFSSSGQFASYWNIIKRIASRSDSFKSGQNNGDGIYLPSNFSWQKKTFLINEKYFIYPKLSMMDPKQGIFQKEKKLFKVFLLFSPPNIHFDPKWTWIRLYFSSASFYPILTLIPYFLKNFYELFKNKKILKKFGFLNKPPKFNFWTWNFKKFKMDFFLRFYGKQTKYQIYLDFGLFPIKKLKIHFEIFWNFMFKNWIFWFI